VEGRAVVVDVEHSLVSEPWEQPRRVDPDPAALLPFGDVLEELLWCVGGPTIDGRPWLRDETRADAEIGEDLAERANEELHDGDLPARDGELARRDEETIDVRGIDLSRAW
jgi:hypothetical protein